MKSESFFDKYAAEYDWLTNAEGRVEGHRREVNALIDRFHPCRVLDAGCATGMTTSLFASQGIETVGLDRSRDMLKTAREKFSSLDLPLNFRQGSFESLPKSLGGSFDLVVCLANSIVGVESQSNLRKSLAGFMRVLKPGGHLVLQALNIKSLSDRSIRQVKTAQHDGIIYSRFLERAGSRSVLHIVRIDTRETPPHAELFRHESVSFTRELLVSCLNRSGFSNIRSFADLTMKQRFSLTARDIVLAAQRSQ